MATQKNIIRSTSGQHANYAAFALLGWASVGTIALAYTILLQLPLVAYGPIGAAMLIMGTLHLPKAWDAQKRQDQLTGDNVSVIGDEELKEQMQEVSASQTGNAITRFLRLTRTEHHEAIYLGNGFVWGAEHAIKAWEIQNEIVQVPKQPPQQRGQLWIHALASETEKIGLLTAHTSGNVSIYGTTGAGKTKLYILFLKQAILRGEPVVVIDPKGDKELRRVMRETCENMGNPDRFAMLHPGFPDDCVRINPLANFNKPSELASRVADLLPNAKGGDPFVQFITNVLTYIVSGMLMTGEKVTLDGIASYVHNGTDGLLRDSIKMHASKYDKNWESNLSQYMKKDAKTDQDQLNGLILYYQKSLRLKSKSTEIEGLIDMTVHDRSHFEKMIVSLHPVLTFLTSGDIGPLLSPDTSDFSDKRDITNLTRLIENDCALYVGLDTLSDARVGSAISNLLLADMAAFSGDRYNYTDLETPVNFFADEAGEVMTPPLVRVLNKARGSGVRTFMAAQTFSDYIVALGSKDAAHQATGNANTIISLRQMDPETQKEVLGSLPKVSMETRSLGRTGSVRGAASRVTDGNVSEKIDTTEIERVSESLLSSLPNFEYFARFPNGQLIKGRFPIVT